MARNNSKKKDMRELVTLFKVLFSLSSSTGPVLDVARIPTKRAVNIEVTHVKTETRMQYSLFRF